MTSYLENLGQSVLNFIFSLFEIITFTLKVLFRLFRGKTYSSAMRNVLIDQIYFTSVQIIPFFLAISIFFGSLLIGIVFTLLKELGLTDFIGPVFMGLIVVELCPFLTVLLITLRSSAAINTEIAVMKVNREIEMLEMFRIDVLDYLLIPRVLNGIISTVLLSFLFACVLLSSGILFSGIIFGMSLDAYTNILLSSTRFSDIFIALIKCAVFGFFITLIPIRFGLGASEELTSIPVSVSAGMVNVFGSILIIEVLSLLIKLF